MNYDNIPKEMKALPQWVVYKSFLDPETNKYKKIIVSPVTGSLAKSTDPATWEEFHRAIFG